MTHHDSLTSPYENSIGWLLLVGIALVASTALGGCAQPLAGSCSDLYEVDADGAIQFTPRGLHRIELAARRFWTGSRYDESWDAAAARSMEACGRDFTTAELLLVAAEHPRTHRDPFWQIWFLQVLEEHYEWVFGGIYDEPNCRLIREAIASNDTKALAAPSADVLDQPAKRAGEQ